MLDQDQKRLADVLPPEFMQGSSPAMRYASESVIREYGTQEHPWPGPQKSVSKWYALANGKAVGVIQVRNRWSFPVIAYSPDVSTVVLRFAGQQHQTLHEVLIDFGFSFTVSSQYKVGLEYSHPEKPVRVILKPVDEELEYFCIKPDDGAYEEQDYGKAEWEYISEAETEEETLRRDLHVLIHVRPQRLFE